MKINDISELSNINIKTLSSAYLIAKRNVINQGFEYEIDWQISTKQILLTEEIFLREAAWVILSAGMSERAIRSVFPQFSRAFFNWKSADEITDSVANCREKAIMTFKNSKKIEAIIEIVFHVTANGFEYVRQSIEDEGINYISKFPFMGPATSFHLAKNLGLSVAKPDRHLLRIANAFGYTDVQCFCADIAEYVGDDIAEIDLILWRYATIDSNYINSLKTFSNLDWESHFFIH